MPLRAVRVPAAIWEPAKARAKDEGTTVSAVVRDALEEYGQAANDE